MAQEGQRTWGDPSAISNMLIATAALCLFALFTGKVPIAAVDPATGTINVGAIALLGWIAAVLVCVTIAGIIHFVRGETVPGLVAIVFGPLVSFWAMLNPIVKTVLPYFGPHMEVTGVMTYPAVHATDKLDGYGLAVVAGLFAIFWVTSLKIPRAFTGLLTLLVITFALLAAWNFQEVYNPVTGALSAPAPIDSAYAQIAGWLLLVLSIYFFYLAAAGVINPVYQREVLPLGKPILK